MEKEYIVLVMCKDLYRIPWKADTRFSRRYYVTDGRTKGSVIHTWLFFNSYRKAKKKLADYHCVIRKYVDAGLFK